MKQQEQLMKMMANRLDEAKIPYTYIEEAALVLQGVPVRLDKIHILVQWDVFSDCHQLFIEEAVSPIEKTATAASFELMVQNSVFVFSCLFNTTIKTDPYRIQVDDVWCRSMYSCLYGNDFNKYRSIIVEFLYDKQQALTKHNEQAWNQNNYQALIKRYGEPAVIAEKIKQNPEWRLYPFLEYMKELKGKKVLHLLGSNGVKATAMSLLGAEVTVVDFSKENAQFASEVAKEANVDITYIVSDVFSAPAIELEGKFDYVLMELGVLHYFITLEPLMKMISRFLIPEGKFILHEFHPISTKLITSSGKKHKVTGNYFNPELVYQTVAFSKHMENGEQEELMQTVQRKWTIGELVTSVASSGLVIETLEEEPNHKLYDIGLPKTFTLVSKK